MAQTIAMEDGFHIGIEELTRCTQVAGPLPDTACKAARSLSKNYGSAWMHQYVPLQCKWP